jgi:hypothetical protein
MSRKKVPRLRLQALDGRDLPSTILGPDAVVGTVAVTTTTTDQVASAQPVDSTGNPLPPSGSDGTQTGTTTPPPPPPPTSPTRLV